MGSKLLRDWQLAAFSSHTFAPYNPFVAEKLDFVDDSLSSDFLLLHSIHCWRSKVRCVGQHFESDFFFCHSLVNIPNTDRSARCLCFLAEIGAAPILRFSIMTLCVSCIDACAGARTIGIQQHQAWFLQMLVKTS